MSLFKARSWWSVKGDEVYGEGGLVVGNVDNAADGAAKVVTGSLDGVLRIHNPALYKGGSGSEEVTSLLVETRLEAPILELKLGRLKPSDESGSVGLAVLHPRKLCVYSVESKSLDAESSVHELVPQYAHRLGIDGEHFTASTMCLGPFGGSRSGRGKDLMLVQSMDCRITVYEQDAEAFTRRLTDCLLPGPLCYVPATDSLVTCSSTLEIRSYKYGAVASSADDGDHRLKAGITARRVMVPEWAVDVGDLVLYLSAASIEGKAVVVAVAERGLYVVNASTGALISQRLLDFQAVASCVYEPKRLVPDHQKHSLLLVGATDGRLAVFSLDRCKTLWVARSPHDDQSAPLAVTVCDLVDKPGMIAVLDDAGRLTLSYLGTEPARDASSTSRSGVNAVGYAELFEEMKRLKAKLAAANANSQQETDGGHKQVTIRAQPPGALVDDDDDAIDPDLATELGLVRRPPELSEADEQQPPALGPLCSVTARLYVTASGEDAVVATTISAPSWVYCDSATTRHVVSSSNSTPQVVRANLYAKADVPASTTVTVSSCATRPGSTAAPRCASTRFRLPMCLACHAILPPRRDATLKLTFDTDRDAAPLKLLFADMLAPDAEPASGLSFEFWFDSGSDDKATATILVSKKKGSYRVQATAVPAMWLAADELVARLRDSTCVVSYADDLPLGDVYAAIDAHHAARLDVRRAEAELNDAAHELRVIEKRLLVRFKDSRPAPLNNLDKLLANAHHRVLDLADAVQRAQRARDASAATLEAAVRLLLLLLTLRFSLDASQADLLHAAFHPDVHAFNQTGQDDPQAGWEELTDAALAFLLKTALSTKNHDVDHASHSHVALAFPQTTDKLKRHIAMVCDRLDRGNRPRVAPRRAPRRPARN